MAYLAGLIASRSSTPADLVPFPALCLLVNSKQAFTVWLRKRRFDRHLAVFMAQVLTAAVLLVWWFGASTTELLPLLVIPMIYLVLVAVAGEHFVMTELAGFGVLSLAAAIASCSATGSVDYVVYASVAVFFAAGVFKVRTQLRKRMRERTVMGLYVLFAGLLFVMLGIPVIVLLPLLENVYYAISLYRVRLAVTGWVELAKSVSFLVLVAFFF